MVADTIVLPHRKEICVDIILQVLRHFEHREWDCDRDGLEVERTSSLSCFARTCKAFFSLAVPILWRRLRSLTPLLHLIGINANIRDHVEHVCSHHPSVIDIWLTLIPENGEPDDAPICVGSPLPIRRIGRRTGYNPRRIPSRSMHMARPATSRSGRTPFAQPSQPSMAYYLDPVHGPCTTSFSLLEGAGAPVLHFTRAPLTHGATRMGFRPLDASCPNTAHSSAHSHLVVVLRLPFTSGALPYLQIGFPSVLPIVR